jgi:ribose transport system permease protein
LGQRSLFNGVLPIPIIIMAIVYAIVYFVLNDTPFGRHMYAIGGNEEASHLSGINVAKTKMLAYMTSGLMAAVAGIIITARVASATPTAGEGYELDAIAAVVIGGTSLRGGEGKMLYTLAGALIIGMLNNILNLTNVSAYYQTIVKGVVILTAVLLDARSRKT